MKPGHISTDAPPRRDVYQRARLFDRRSFGHHAKANLNLVQALIDRYSAPGDLVLDPMGGTGSIYVALLTGRRVIAGDIEAQWTRLLRNNAALVRRDNLIAFSTEALTARWDAARLPVASVSVDLIVTSPPYFDSFSNWGAADKRLVPAPRQNEHGLAYGLHERQIGNIHVYERYLRAMRPVYAEMRRVLGAQGNLALIVKDVIRSGRTLPLVDDTLSLCLASGFTLVERLDVPARGSQFTNINRQRHGLIAPKYEPVLILRPADIGTKKRLALLELPKPTDGPGRVIVLKAIAHARAGGYEVWVRFANEAHFCRHRAARNGFWLHSALDDRRNGVSVGDPPARVRREAMHAAARELVTKAGLVTGDEIAFYGGQRCGRYLVERLATLGCEVAQPLAGLNNGQRLGWLTEAGF